MHAACYLGISAAVSESNPRAKPKTATNAGCPIQAVLWLEWDTTGFCPEFSPQPGTVRFARRHYRP
jgi:hypothetical protein